MIEYDFTETVVAAPIALSLQWSKGKIVETHLSWSKGVIESSEHSKSCIQLKIALQEYVAGKTPNWPALPFDFSQMTDFQRNVMEALYRVPSGTVTTYGALAEQVGSAQGAQAIGKAMGANPFPLIYPCHRVIGKDGTLTGFSAEGGLELKEYLLELEGAGKRRPVEIQGSLL
jgi:methylated-DNA-[protein]-cysteine S-methyltransferase